MVDDQRDRMKRVVSDVPVLHILELLILLLDDLVLLLELHLECVGRLTLLRLGPLLPLGLGLCPIQLGILIRSLFHTTHADAPGTRRRL